MLAHISLRIVIWFWLPPAPIAAQHLTDPGEATSARRFAQLQQTLGGDASVDSIERFLHARYLAGQLQMADGTDVALYQQAKAGKLPASFFTGQAARLYGRSGVSVASVDTLLGSKLDFPFQQKMSDVLGIPLPDDDDDPGWLERTGISIRIRRSFFDAAQTGLPARIAWTHYGGEDETSTGRRTFLDVDGAIWAEFAKPIRGDLGSHELRLWPILAVEADTSTREGDGRDRVVHRIGFDSDITDRGQGPWVPAYHVKATFDFATDRDYDAEVLGGTVQLFPTVFGAGIGNSLPIFDDVMFRWRPYLEASYGDIVDAGGNMALASRRDYLDVAGRIVGELRWDRLRLTGEARYARPTRGRSDDHFYHSVTLRQLLDEDDRVSISASYERGEEGPLYQDLERFLIAISIKL